VALCLRYLIEEMTEDEILAIDADAANCGVTEYVLERKSSGAASEDHGLRLVTYKFVAPLVEAGAPITTTPDQPAAAK